MANTYDLYGEELDDEELIPVKVSYEAHKPQRPTIIDSDREFPIPFLEDIFPANHAFRTLLENRDMDLEGDPMDLPPWPEHRVDDTRLTAPRSFSEGNQLTRLRKPKMELPLIIQGSTVVSRPDSGSEENIISAELAQQLSLGIDSSIEYQRDFRIGNGKLVKALGRVVTSCVFAKDTMVELRCLFYVFRALVTPIIMGMSFLDETETLSKNRHRLQPRTSIPRGPFELYSINHPKRRLLCIAESEAMLACADTGSELDLMSLAYLRRRNFQLDSLDPHESLVQFADGSVSWLQGRVTISIALGRYDGPRLDVVFYVLEDLTCDLLLGEDFLNENDAFQTYREAFSKDESDELPADVNTIVWFNSVEQFFAKFGFRTKATYGDAANTAHDTGFQKLTSFAKRATNIFGTSSHTHDKSSTSSAADSPISLLLRRINESDAAESHRREEADLKISNCPSDERSCAQRDENARRQDYESQKEHLLSGVREKICSGGEKPKDPLCPAGFSCGSPGCTASPFLTEELLNSHMYIHSQNRPRHYCPIAECSRSQGGTGFKRKNELIRHGLAHMGPGYICPFCPERKHKYPRPDSLQRHVRMNHTNMDTDDPRLREVLAQRPESNHRGRRWGWW